MYSGVNIGGRTDAPMSRPPKKRVGRKRLPRMVWLRHSLSTGLLAAGVPSSQVQSKLGHKSRRTTEEQYAELFPEVLEAEPPPPAPVPEKVRQKAEKTGTARQAG